MSLSDHMFSDTTRQAWRDNYNGGRAAGDFAGVYSNHGGSSDHSVSSGQTAGDSDKQGGASASVQRVVASVPTAGPGSPAVATARSVPTRGPGAFAFGVGPVSHVAVSDLPPLEMGHKDSGTNILAGGDWWQGNPWWSDTEEFEARYGEPGDWVGGIVVFGADLTFNAARAVDWLSIDAQTSDPARNAVVDWSQIENGPGALTNVQKWITDADAVASQAFHRTFNTGVAVPRGRF